MHINMCPVKNVLWEGMCCYQAKVVKINKDGGMRPFIPKQNQLKCICPPAVNRVSQLLWPVYKWWP